MKEIILTSPFTGLEFHALEQLDGTLIVKNPISGCMHYIKYDASTGNICIPRMLFNHVETVNAKQASKILGVSRQRVSAIAKNGNIRACYIANSLHFLLDDVLEFKETRKSGRPVKESKNGAGNNQHDR